jgi:hypothetical protein
MEMVATQHAAAKVRSAEVDAQFVALNGEIRAMEEPA